MRLNSRKTFYNYHKPDPNDDGDGDEVLLYATNVNGAMAREQFRIALIDYVESLLDLADEHNSLEISVEIR